jgi:hypothetical protein
MGLNRAATMLMLAITLSLLAVALGLWNLYEAVGAIFVFREGEPWNSWVWILFGPTAILPVALLSFYQREAAGYLLIFSAVISFVAFAMDEGSLEYLLPFLGMTIGPMLAIGIGFVFLARERDRLTD